MADPTLLRDSVYLAGVEYFIRGPVIAQPVSDFAANVRIGEPSYETRQGAGYGVFEDLSGGPGIINGLMREDLGRYADTTGLDTRFSRQLTAPLSWVASSNSPDASTGAVSGDIYWIGQTNRAFHHYVTSGGTSYIVFAYAQGINYRTPSDDAGTAWTTTASGLDPIEDATVFTPPTTGVPQYITIGYDGWRRGVTSVVSPTELSSQRMYTCLAWAGKLLMQTHGTSLGTVAGDVIVSLDGDTFVKDSGGTNCDVIWRLPRGHFLGPAPAPWGESAPWFFSGSGLYVLNFWDRAAYQVSAGLANIRCATPWQDGLVLSNGQDIIQYVPGNPGTIRRIGLGKEQGFLEGGNWYVNMLWADGAGPLYAALYNGSPTDDLCWLWEFSGAVWHPIGRASTMSGGGAALPIGIGVTDKAAGGPCTVDPRRKYWLMANDQGTPPNDTVESWRAMDPLGDTNPLIGTAAFSTTATTITTPWLDGGFRELSGAALQMWFSGTASATLTVKVEYAVDGAAGWTSPTHYSGIFDGGNTYADDHFNFGTADTNGAYPGISFRTIRFRITLTATAAATPNGLPLTFVFRKKPGLRMSYLFNVDAAKELEENSKELATILTALAIAWNSNTLVRFYYPVRTEADAAVAEGNLEVDKRVDIVSMPTREEDIQDAVRKGVITVQVMEPCDW